MRKLLLLLTTLCLSTKMHAMSCRIIFDLDSKTTKPTELELLGEEERTLQQHEFALTRLLAIGQNPVKQNSSWLKELLRTLSNRLRFFAELSEELFPPAINGTAWAKQQFMQANARLLMDADSMISLMPKIFTSYDKALNKEILEPFGEKLILSIARDLQLHNNRLAVVKITQEFLGLGDGAPFRFDGIEWEEDLSDKELAMLLSHSDIKPTHLQSNKVTFTYFPLLELYTNANYRYMEERRLYYTGSISFHIDRIRNHTQIMMPSPIRAMVLGSE